MDVEFCSCYTFCYEAKYTDLPVVPHTHRSIVLLVSWARLLPVDSLAAHETIVLPVSWARLLPVDSLAHETIVLCSYLSTTSAERALVWIPFP